MAQKSEGAGAATRGDAASSAARPSEPGSTVAVLIELGERRDPPPPARPDRRTARQWVVAALAAALLGGAVGSAGPVSPPADVRVPAPAGATFELSGDTLYVSGSPTPDDPAKTITAYGMPDGRRLWQRSLRSEGFVSFGDGLLVPLSDGGGATEGLMALDRNTGVVRWRHDGDFLDLAPGRPGRPGTVLLSHPPQGEPEVAPERIEAIDSRTGEPRWSYRLPAGVRAVLAWHGAGAIPRLVLAMRSGRVEVRELPSGRQLAGAAVRRPGDVAPDGTPWLTVDDDLILVDDGNGRTVTGYGLDRLDRRWSAELPGASLYTLVRCAADLLCADGGGGGTVRAVSRTTGAPRWQARLAWPMPVGESMLAFDNAGGDATGLAPAAPMVLADPATGAVRHALGRWQLGPQSVAGGVFLFHLDPGSSRTWFGVLHPGADRVRILRAVAGVDGECRATERGTDVSPAASGVRSGGLDGVTVACRRRDGAIGVWRLP